MQIYIHDISTIPQEKARNFSRISKNYNISHLQGKNLTECNYMKNHKENCFNICNQTTHGTFVCFFKLHKTENLLLFAMFPM